MFEAAGGTVLANLLTENGIGFASAERRGRRRARSLYATVTVWSPQIMAFARFDAISKISTFVG
jgi:hypothetical protein